MAEVLFASAHVRKLDRDDTFPARFRRLLDKADFGRRFKDQRVAIKMHVGSDIGFYTIHPIFVRMVVDAVKSAGGSPFLTDGAFSTGSAVARGYTNEVVGARVVGASGEHDRYYYQRETSVPGLPSVDLCGNIVDADAMIVLSHGKGHGMTGFGGAIKNIGMGCVSYKTRGAIHALSGSHFQWDSEQCTHCEQCVSGCPTGAARFDDDGNLNIFPHHCRFCGHCVTSCPSGALTMEHPEEKFVLFQSGMAAVVKETLATFEPGRVYFITLLLNVTPLCDCWGFSTPPIVPDVGAYAGENIVAVEQAALDAVKSENLIASTVPDQLLPLASEEGHLFARLHGKDPYEQVRQCATAGLGDPKYTVVEVV